MAQGGAVVVRLEPVARAALGIMRVVRTIRNFLVAPYPSTGLTALYDLCISSLFQVVFHPPEGFERGTAALRALRRDEPRLRRAERQALLAESSQQEPWRTKPCLC